MVVFKEEKKKEVYGDPFFERDGSIRNFRNIKQFVDAKDEKLDIVLNTSVNE